MKQISLIPFREIPPAYPAYRQAGPEPGMVWGTGKRCGFRVDVITFDIDQMITHRYHYTRFADASWMHSPFEIKTIQNGEP